MSHDPIPDRIQASGSPINGFYSKLNSTDERGASLAEAATATNLPGSATHM